MNGLVAHNFGKQSCTACRAEKRRAMDAAELRKLAEEREARHRAAGGAGPGAGTGARNAVSGGGGARTAAAAAKPRAVSARVPMLFRAHRSIRMAHSLGFFICIFALILLPFPWVTRTKILLGFMFLLGAWLARSGGAFVHGWLPALLVEGSAPSPAGDVCLRPLLRGAPF